MTYVTPVLKDRVPYDWDALKASTIGREVPHAVEHTAPDMSFFKPEQRQPEAVQQILQESHESAEPQVQTTVSEVNPATNPAASVSDSEKNALVNEIVEAVVPLIMQRLHGQVSMMVDLTMKQAAKKIRNDFDDALKGTVRKAVEQVVKEKIG